MGRGGWTEVGAVQIPTFQMEGGRGRENIELFCISFTCLLSINLIILFHLLLWSVSLPVCVSVAFCSWHRLVKTILLFLSHLSNEELRITDMPPHDPTL